MKNQIEFLEHIKNEIATAEYGEGISFNLNLIVRTIDERIRQVKKISRLNEVGAVNEMIKQNNII